MPKTIKDLKKITPNFKQFCRFISEFKEIVDSGKLAEFYCSRLFSLKLVEPRNSNIDAIDPEGKKIEIKHRSYSTEIPPGMKINLDNIDYLFYVKLNKENLLPEEIYKIKAKDIEYTDTKAKRVSFKKAFKKKKVEVVFKKD